MPVPDIIKIFQTIKKLWSAQEAGLEIHSGEITQEKEQSKSCPFMWHSYLIWYMSHQNIIKLPQTLWEM